MAPYNSSRYRSIPYKSKPERQLGSLLSHYNIPFAYEKPTAVIDAGKTRIYYPDFTLSYGLLLEYFGINGNQEYADRTRHKLKVYEENQVDVLPLYPIDMRGPWQQRLLRRIDTSLHHRLNDYRCRTGMEDSYMPRG